MSKKYKLQFTSKSNSDYYNMLENSAYISLNYYKKISSEFRAKVKNLLEYPYIYQIVQNKKQLRKMTIFNYILLYKVHNNTVIICRIFSNKINYKKYISDL